MTNGHSSLEKYTSHFIWKGCVWGGVGDWTELQHIDPPTSLAITAFLSRSPGLLNWGPGGPASAGTWSSFQHLLSNWSELQLLNRGPEGPLCWVLVLSTTSYLQLTDFLSSSRLYNCSMPSFFLWASQIALNSTHPQSRLYPDIPRPDAPVIYTGAFPILTAWPGRRSICNRLSSLAFD